MLAAGLKFFLVSFYLGEIRCQAEKGLNENAHILSGRGGDFLNTPGKANVFIAYNFLLTTKPLITARRRLYL